MASLLLIFLSPIYVIISILIVWKLGFPIFFRQRRPGLQGKIFVLIKFRTMKCDKDLSCKTPSDLYRMTSFGKFLRSTSLDELPELWNVIRGDMSLVGPRPLLEEYLPHYNEKQKRRHEVKPGITGLTQIKGRNNLSWKKKFALDIWYVDNQNFWLDLKILLITIKKVLLREGITSKGYPTAKKFKGNNL